MSTNLTVKLEGAALDSYLTSRYKIEEKPQRGIGIIVKTVNEYEFINDFKSYGREDFTHAALVALYEYLEDYSRDTGEPVELDVIALCCEYAEYENLDEIKAAYSMHADIETIEDLREHTQVIEFKYGIIIQEF
jgi:hypothetical protein|tara:strand:+ start:108 stop:509 length:402 start_codon:yes stop_codon:yes gene_type:complete